MKNQLINKNLANIAAQDSRLALAVRGSRLNKNFNIGAATQSEAERLGAIWVGDGARKTSGGAWLSSDGTRQYRPPFIKNSSFATTGMQANFEIFSIDPITGARVKMQNAHLDIIK